jgi:hypothetical protein
MPIYAVLTLLLVAQAAMEVGAEQVLLAAETPRMSPKCLDDFNAWKQSQPPNGAFAVGEDGSCGLSWGYPSLEEATSVALKKCREYHPNCRVLETKAGEAPPADDKAEPAGAGAQLVEVCK